NWEAVWYELELPYGSNNVDVFVQADGAISNGGIILMDDCACDDYIANTGFDWDPAGGWLNVWFDEVSGADNGGTILFPLMVVEPQGYTVTFDVTSPPNPAVFFSEYAEGSSNHKYLEIYNGTGADVSLNDYVILGNYNGNPYSETFTFATDATLASGDVYVLANDAADSSILAEADEVFAYGDPWYITSFNGDDVRALSHLSGADTVIIDIIGTLEGGDPGSGWAVAGVDNATKDHTLVRKASVGIGNDGDWASSAGTDADDSEWIVFDQNEWSYVGSHPHCFEPNVLIVNMYDAYGDGWNGNVLTIGEQEFELTSGDFATGEACLPYGDFAVTCDGGSWQEEVSWEILNETGDLLLAGGAPYSGTLSLEPPYTLTLSTASYGSEVSWAITAAGDSGNAIYSGSGYSSNTDYEFGLDLADGDYEFHMYDSYGDSWNGATYSIDDAAGHNISSGGLTDYTNYGMDPFSVPWQAPLYPYYFTLNTASWASEISWAVTAAGDSGNAIYTGSGYSNNSTYTDTLDLADGDYEFHMYDSYGDSWNGATYVILDGDGNTISAGGLTDYTNYGMNPFSVPFVFPYNLTLTTASWASEISWTITAAGDSIAVYSGSGYSNSTEYVIGLELDDGDYEFHMYDAYGDGWNGATYSIDDAAGNNISSGGLASGDYGMDPFSVPWIPPITGNSCEDAFSYGTINGDPQVGATTESGDADWYSFEVDVDYDNVSVSLCESGFDTKLEVWGACADTDYLGYNDDFCGLQSQVDLTDVAAGTYHAKVYGYGSSFGDYILTITGSNAPEAPVLTATAGVEEIVLDWEPIPTRGMYSPQTDINGTNPSKQENKQGNYIQYDPSDYPAPRQGGDTIGDATAIDALPFDAAGTTDGYVDDYDEE
ncbi:MAG: lamin tail domain-containing protein, partial [Candidatus Marinimicrobia bacterium]|nr:lamin tail domain-containing protein [Candidatus Neomarinimicrobiota bacterium]